MRRYRIRNGAFAALGLALAGCGSQSGNETVPAGNQAPPAESNVAEPANAAEPATAEGASAQTPPAETDSQPPVRVGERFEVALPQSAGTGYSWELKSPPSGTVEFIDKSVETPPRPAGSGPMVGGAQNVLFRFRAAAPGQAELVFVNRRPWAPQPDDETVTRKITVTP
ncbi:MAG TPA: protease inhibitor I42 family protein [Allosphingosinicella sp.]